ncbi:hypothetical protein PSTG_16705 [Puccinia striiformis f. sp. tritici PST-78]|uniref:Threonine/serine exporter-like N-terminal domain-containing protein n=1 Tax=Puccinia striiformis f. sp. tritici PST-78 TaxID=1165861 RepID=A0A0L0US86_9BASI|nr:hypothetical protein PSTG_16705 [Puccinia striiformis f. sp. tritici PST-78]
MASPDRCRLETPDSDLNIPFGERDGLPCNGKSRTFIREAANLVSLHKFNISSALGRSRPGQSTGTSGPGLSTVASHDAAARESCVLSTGGSLSSPGAGPSRSGMEEMSISMGHGVLSSLLHLYTHPTGVQSSSTTLIDYDSDEESGAGRARAMENGVVASPTNIELASRNFLPPPLTPTLTLTSDEPYGQTAHASPRQHSEPLRRVTSAGELTRSHPEDAGMDPFSPTPPHGRRGHENSTGARLASSANSVICSTLKTCSRKMSNIGSIKALGDAMKPTNFHNESDLLKAKKSGRPSGNTPGTPSTEFFETEKLPLGPPHQIHINPNQVPFAASQQNKHERKRREKRREKRRQEEIFVTMHVADILQRQQFILQLTRALMMFGGPSHRLESQVLATARVLGINLQVILVYTVCIIAFQDEATHTSETKFIKQSPIVDLGKLTDLATLHWEVVHDKIGVQEASQEISRLMRAPPQYKDWQVILIGAMCSAFLGPAAYRASFVDALISAPLGAGLVAAKLFVASRSDAFSQIFEILATGFASFIAAGLASTGYFCYSTVIVSSIDHILPGWLVCCAALELQSRSIVSGSVRLIWAIIYALSLGLGISGGAEFWTLFSGKPVQVSVDGTCGISHNPDKWYRATMPLRSTFLVMPAYALFLALSQNARLKTKEIFAMVLLASGGFGANRIAALAFPDRSDISAAFGSFIVGFLASIYGRLFQGTSFIIALVPILYQVPSGLGHGGLLYFANTSDSPHSFTSGFQVGQQLLEVCLGLVIGLFVATVLVYPMGNRGSGLMTL